MSSREIQPNRHEGRAREADYPRHSRHRPSAVGHWTRTIGALVPLAITELVPEPGKQIRFIRIASVALAVLNEGRYAYQVHQERRGRAEEKREYRR